MSAIKLPVHSQRMVATNFTRVVQLLVAVLMVCTATVSQPVSQVSLAQEAPDGSAPVSVYLPIMVKNFPLQNIFGISMSVVNEANGLTPIADAGTTWVRIGLPWKNVENVEGARNWDSAVEAQLITAYQHNLRVVLLIEDTPSWALKSGYTCGAVASNKFSALAKFLADAVKRYSLPPYNVKYWELWNEPDAAGLLGCWGDPSDTQYYGGRYYGSMLPQVYPAMKAANAQAQVLVGGLLLDCDPGLPPSGRTCVESNFLKGILAVGAGPYFDGVSFHAYDYYVAAGRYSNTNWHSSTESTGPTLLAKADYLQTVLKAYGYPNKYLISTETAVFYGGLEHLYSCPADVPADYEWTKAYYLVHSYTAAQAKGLQANLWYAAIAGRCTSLFDESTLAPKPAFQAYKFLRTRLQGAQFSRKVTQYMGANVVGYEFKRGTRTVWVMWAMDGAPHSVQLTATPVEVLSIGQDGNPVDQVEATTITVDVAPQVIEFES